MAFILEEILWYELCENTPANSEQSAKHFGELANALQILHCCSGDWSEDDIISVLDEITSKLSPITCSFSLPLHFYTYM